MLWKITSSATLNTCTAVLPYIFPKNLLVRWLVTVCSVKTFGPRSSMRGVPLHMYYIHFGQYSHPIGSGWPPLAAGKFSISRKMCGGLKKCWGSNVHLVVLSEFSKSIDIHVSLWYKFYFFFECGSESHCNKRMNFICCNDFLNQRDIADDRGTFHEVFLDLVAGSEDLNCTSVSPVLWPVTTCIISLQWRDKNQKNHGDTGLQELPWKSNHSDN